MILKNGKRLDGCSDTVPIGTINPYMGSVAPYGYLICEGQLVSKTTYKELYEICGDKFGTGTTTEFRLPDLRGKTITGYKEGDDTFGTLGGLVGDLIHTHEYGITYQSNSGVLLGDGTLGNDLIGIYDNGVKTKAKTTSTTTTKTLSYAKDSRAGELTYTYEAKANTTASSNLQPSINMNWIVKAFLLMPNQSYVENSLTSSSEINALSAKQGKALNDKFNNYILTSNIVNNVTSTDTNKPLSANQGKVLNDKINGKQNIIADTGWISLPLTSSVSTGGLSCTPKYRKVGNHVYIKGSIVSSSGGDTVTIASLPTGFRPVERLDYFAPAGGKCIARILISAAGDIKLDYIGDWAANTWYSGSAWIDIRIDFFID